MPINITHAPGDTLRVDHIEITFTKGGKAVVSPACNMKLLDAQGYIKKTWRKNPDHLQMLVLTEGR